LKSILQDLTHSYVRQNCKKGEVMQSVKDFTKVLFLLLIILEHSPAQNINYGLSVGYVRTTPIMDKENFQKGISSENQFNLMAILEISHESSVRVQTGLRYFKMEYSNDYNRDDIMYFVPPPLRSITTLSFIAIPIDFNYSLPFLSDLYLSWGIEAAKVISASSVDYYYSKTEKDNIINNYRKLNFLIFIGFGFEKRIDKVILFIEPEYSRSIQTILNSNALSKLEIEQFSLNVGIKF